jgi:hypothetical protein
MRPDRGRQARSLVPLVSGDAPLSADLNSGPLGRRAPFAPYPWHLHGISRNLNMPANQQQIRSEFGTPSASHPPRANSDPGTPLRGYQPATDRFGVWHALLSLPHGESPRTFVPLKPNPKK